MSEARRGRLGLHGRLAILALALAGLGLFARPQPGRVVGIDTTALALDATHESDSLAPAELADWIIEGRADFRLIDARDAAAYAGYHVPLAENLPLTALTGDALLRNETVVLYAADEMRTAQAWLLLKARGQKAVYWLEGGLEGWKDEVLFPRLPDEPAAGERDRVARAREVSLRFGGKPRGGDAADEDLAAAALPEAPPAPPPAAARPKKKKGGC